jgi:hypothetical protein
MVQGLETRGTLTLRIAAISFFVTLTGHKNEKRVLSAYHHEGALGVWS